MSMADSTTAMAFAYAGAPWMVDALFFSSAGNAAYRDAKEKGATQDQAMAIGVLSGAAEAIFEHASIEHFMKMDYKGKGALIKNLLSQATAEGSEEVSTEIANTLTDAWIMRDKSEYNQAVKEYSKTMSESEAKAKAFMDQLADIGMAGLGGAVSGALFGLGGALIAPARYNSEGKRLSKNTQEQAQVIRLAQLMGGEALEALDKYNAAQTNRNLGELSATVNQKLHDMFGDEKAPDLKTATKESVVDKATAYAALLSGEKMTVNGADAVMKVMGKDTLQEMGYDTSTPKAFAQDYNKRLQKYGIQSQAETTTEIAKTFAQRNEYSASEEEALKNATHGTFGARQAAQSAAANRYAMRENTYTASEGLAMARQQTRTEANITAAKTGAANRVWENPEQGLAQTINGRTVTPMPGNLTAVSFAEQQRTNFKANATATSGNVTYAVAGMQAREGLSNAQTLSEIKKSLTKEARNKAEVYEKLAKALGLKLTIHDVMVGTNGFIDEKGNMHVVLSGKQSVLRVAAHELTHYMKEHAGTHYSAMREHLINEVGQARFDRMITRKALEYGLDLSTETGRTVADDEVCAELCERMLSDKKALTKFAEKNTAAAKTLKDHLAKILNAIKAALKDKKNRDFGASWSDLIGSQETIESWITGLQEAIRNAEAGVQETKTEKKQYAANEELLMSAEDVRQEDIEKSAKASADLGKDVYGYTRKQINDVIAEGVFGDKSNYDSGEYSRISSMIAQLVPDITAALEGEEDQLDTYDKVRAVVGIMLDGYFEDDTVDASGLRERFPDVIGISSNLKADIAYSERNLRQVANAISKALGKRVTVVGEGNAKFATAEKMDTLWEALRDQYALDDSMDWSNDVDKLVDFLDSMTGDRKSFDDLYKSQRQEIIEDKALGIWNAVEKMYSEKTGEEGGVRYSLMQFEDGKRFVAIDQDQKEFEGKDPSEYPSIAKKIIQRKFVHKIIGIDNKAFANVAFRNEYAHPSKHGIATDIYNAKMRAAGEVDNLLDASSNMRSTREEEYGHAFKKNVVGYDYYDTIFRIGDRYFQGIVNIELNAIGRRIKDITKIKDVTQDILHSYGPNPKSQILRTSSMDNIADVFEKSNTKSLFSLDNLVEERSDGLVAVHNLTGEELARSLKRGGFPMPSIAVLKQAQGHNRYGDVSVVFGKETIDPQASRSNKVYGGDAWTPVYPTIEYKPNAKVADRISKKYYELSRKIGYDKTRPMYNYVTDMERQLNNSKGEAAMLQKLYEDTDMMQVFLDDTGLGRVEDIYNETRTEMSKGDRDFYSWFIDELGEDTVIGYTPSDELTGKERIAHRRQYLNDNQQKIIDAYKRVWSNHFGFSKSEIDNAASSLDNRQLIKYLNDMTHLLKDNGVKVESKFDSDATRKAILEKVDKKEYQAWVDGLFKGIEEKSGIRNNADYWTRSGDRRSFEALHYEDTLENVVKVMREQNQTGNTAIFSGNAIWGVAAKDYKSIAEIKKDSSRLKTLSEEEYNQVKEGYGERFQKIAQAIADKKADNVFIALDNAMENIVDAVRTKKTKDGMLRYLQQYHDNVSMKTVDQIVDLVQDIANMPTEYFEAKPMRAVSADEIKAVILPDGKYAELQTDLSDRGIPVVTYEYGNDADRLRALNSAEVSQYRFSLDLDELSEIDDGVRYNLDTKQGGHRSPIEGGTGYKPAGKGPRAREVNVPVVARNGKRVSDFTRSFLESNKATNEIADELMSKVESGEWGGYTRLTNEEAMDRAKDYIAKRQVTKAQQDFHDMVMSGKYNVHTRALGLQLLTEAAQRGDKVAVLGIASDLRVLATDAGQSVQIFSVLKELGGVGSAWYLNKVVERLNAKYADQIAAGKMSEIKVPDGLMQQLEEARTSQQVTAAEKAVAKSIADQLPLTWADRLSNWRYMAMLANPTTHVRNMFGNLLTGGLNKAKDVVATGIERIGVKDQSKRTHAVLTSADRKTWNGFAEQSYKDNEGLLRGNGKFSFESEIKQNMRSFDTKALNAIAQFNFNMLEKEDMLFIRPAYKNALMQYMKAQGYTMQGGVAGKMVDGKFKAMTKAQTAQAVEYASEQAWKATFHDASALADMLNKISNMNAASRLIVEGVMPFKKTPINIAKRGVEYSPAGVVMGLVQLSRDVKKGKVTTAHAIDNLASGLTGMALMAVGLLLSKAGIIKAGGDDDDKKLATYKQDTGDQTYSLKIGKYSFSLSALAPATIPLFMGAALNEMVSKNGDELDLSAITDTISGTLNPFMEMSFMSSLNSALKNYGSEGIGGALGNTVLTSVENYFSQYLPTVTSKLGQLADPTLRTTKSSATSPIGSGMDYYARSLAKKVPGLEATLQPDVNVWGRETKKDTFQEWALDFANKFILPANVKVSNRDSVDNELMRLVESTGNTDFLPSDGAKKFTVKGESYPMTAAQYTQFSKDRGQASYAALKETMSTDAYWDATDEEKASMLANALTAAQQQVNTMWKERLGAFDRPEEQPTAEENPKTKVQSTQGDYSDPALYKVAASFPNAYDKAAKAKAKGVDPDTFMDLYGYRENYIGEERARDTRKEIMNSDLTPEQKAFMDDLIVSDTGWNPDYSSQAWFDVSMLGKNQYEKAKTGEKLKITPETYLAAYNKDKEIDGAKLGKQKKPTVIKYLDSLNLSAPAYDYLLSAVFGYTTR